MEIVKFYTENEVSQWLQDVGVREETMNSFLSIFQNWKNTTDNFSIFNYPFFSGSYGTEVRSIGDNYVIKGAQRNSIEILKQKIDYYTTNYNISKNIFLPTYCLELEKSHRFTDEFYNFRQEYAKRLNNSTPETESVSFDCLVLQSKAIPMMDLQYQIRTENLGGKDISRLNANLHNLGLLNDKLILFDW